MTNVQTKSGWLIIKKIRLTNVETRSDWLMLKLNLGN